MAEFRTPKRGDDFLGNYSISETPFPQASSTVSKSKSTISQTAGMINDVDNIPSRDSNNKTSVGDSSIASSLGILQLEKLKDFGQDLTSNIEPMEKTFKKPAPITRPSSVRDRLEHQRKLAQSTLDRISLSNQNSIQTSLIKNHKTGKFPSYLLQPETFSISSTPSLRDTSSLHPSYFEETTNGKSKINRKQVSQSESFNEHLAKPGHLSHLENSSILEFSDQFQPGENFGSRFFEDEVSVMREKGFLIPNADITDKLDELSKGSIGEYFHGNRDTDYDFGLPNKNHKQSNNSSRFSNENDFSFQLENARSMSPYIEEKHSIPAKTLTETTSNVLSLTSIQRMLGDLSTDSPGKVINAMITKAHKKLIPSDENKENMNGNSISPKFDYTETSKRSQDNESTARVLYKTSTRTDLQLTESTPIPNKNKLNSNFINNSQSEIASIDCSPDGTLSELNLSAVSSLDSEDWLKILTKSCYIVCGKPSKIIVKLRSNGAWLLAKITFNKIQLLNGPSVTNIATLFPHHKLPVNPVYLTPEDGADFEIELTSTIASQFDYVLDLDLTNMMNKNSTRKMQHSITVFSVNPEITILGAIDNKIDFDTIGAESFCSRKLTIINESLTEVPLILSFEKHDGPFLLSTDVDRPKETSKLHFNLPEGGKKVVPIIMALPEHNSIEGQSVKKYQDRLLIHFGEVDANTCLLKSIDLVGRIGLKNLEFLFAKPPFIITTGNSHYLPIQNTGDVSLKLNTSIMQNDNEQILKLEPESFSLAPHQQIAITLTLTVKPTKTINRVLILTEDSGKEFSYPIQILAQEKPNTKSILSSCFQSTMQAPSPPFSRSDSGYKPVVFDVPDNQYQWPISRPESVNSGISTVSTASSSGTTSDERLPITATKNELAWGCIKINKSDTQELIIRNSSNKRIKFTASINGGNSFKFKDVSENPTSLNIALHGNEIRTLYVVFTPTQMGIVKGRINFTSQNQSKQKNIRLFGCGGHTKMEIMGISTDMSENSWLPMGTCVSAKTILENNIRIRNSGSLTSFCYIQLYNNEFLWVDEPSIKIIPNKFILQPNETRKVSINYNPRKNFATLFTSKNVALIGNLYIAMGPEYTRYRMRALLSQVKGEYSNLEVLNTQFENERTPTDIHKCRKESTKSLVVLRKDIETKNLSLTVQRDTNETILQSEIDETCNFRTLSNDVDQSEYMDDTVVASSTRRFNRNKCYVDPDVLIFKNSTGCYNKFTIISDHMRPLNFQIQIRSNEKLEVSQMSGTIYSNKSCTIEVSLQSTPINDHGLIGTLLVYVENEVLNITLRFEKN